MGQVGQAHLPLVRDKLAHEVDKHKGNLLRAAAFGKREHEIAQQRRLAGTARAEHLPVGRVLGQFDQGRLKFLVDADEGSCAARRLRPIPDLLHERRQRRREGQRGDRVWQQGRNCLV